MTPTSHIKWASCLAVVAGALLLGPAVSFAQSISTDYSTYTNPATVLMYSTGPAGYLTIFENTCGSFYCDPTATGLTGTSGTVGPYTWKDLSTVPWTTGSFDGMTSTGYDLWLTYNTPCVGGTESTCNSANGGSASYGTYFSITGSGGGGGASPPIAPFDEVFGVATSTASAQNVDIVDIPTLDVFLAWTIFMSMAYFTIWLFRKST